jgi:hypothetical protein
MSAHLEDLVQGNHTIRGFHYEPTRDDAVDGMLLYETADGDRFTAIGDPDLVRELEQLAPDSGRPPRALRRRVRYPRRPWLARPGWPDDWKETT